MDVVIAATMAPVSSKQWSLSARAERITSSWWSAGMSQCFTHVCQ